MSAKDKVILTLIALTLMAIFNDEAVSLLMLTVITGTWFGKIIEEGLKND